MQPFREDEGTYVEGDEAVEEYFQKLMSRSVVPPTESVDVES